jgi:UDP-3-O-[3-hydroxymyristoyl] glucosamine N-acyltransferase
MLASEMHVFTMAALMQKIEGAVVRGNPEQVAHRVVHPAKVSASTDLAYIANEKAWDALRHTARLGVVEATLSIPPDIEAYLEAGTHTLLIVPRARVALAILSQLLECSPFVDGGDTGIHPMASIHPEARLGSGVCIGAHSVVGPGCELGDGVILHPNVTLGRDVYVGDASRLHAGVVVGDRVRIGARCILQPNAVIGADGFSYVTAKEARHEKNASRQAAAHEGVLRINSLGTVVLEDDVEIGACSCIDRGTLAETRIARGTKIDNLVQVGHNNNIGEHCLIVSQVGISGSCTIGDRVVIAGQSGLADHLNIGDDAIIMARSGIMRDVEPGAILLGAPALPHREAMANMAQLVRLREMAKEIKQALKRLEAIEASTPPSP